MLVVVGVIIINKKRKRIEMIRKGLIIKIAA